MNGPLVSSDWLLNNLSDPNLVILDASQQDNKAGLVTDSQNYQIVGARVIDIKNNFSDTKSPFPNTLLASKEFEIQCRRLGISKTSKLVVYDNLGIYTSPRVWWMFKAMGFNNIAVLNGGLPTWISKGNPIELSEKGLTYEGDFEAKCPTQYVRDYQNVKANIQSEEELLIDARSADRFNGIAPEPRKGLRSGHIPKSINLPYTVVLRNGAYKSAEELKEVLQPITESNRPLIFSCGSGVTACIVLLACELINLKNTKAVYDGSWTEWAQLDC